MPPPLRKRSFPQILAVDVQEIEGKEHELVRRLMNGLTQGIEDGDAVLVPHDELAIHQGDFAGELGGSIDYRL